MNKVKICGLSRMADIDAVNEARPDYCGFVLCFPRSKRNITPETAKELRKRLRPEIIPVGVLVDQPVEFAAELLNQDIISIVQLHGTEENAYIKRLRQLTKKPIWQAFVIRTKEDVARAANSEADFVLLDAGQGAGKQFDWNLLQGFPRRFGLAGGLQIGNLPEALQTEASLFDVSGGVETDGVKDPDKIKEFVTRVRKG